MQKTSRILTAQDRLQQALPRHCYWDENEQLLYIDARKLFPKIGVVNILGWERMMFDSEPIPDYPDFFKITNWPRQGQFADWLKQIPKWVRDSCALFPSHQMQLLHYAGKYPQVLELLDHAPMLAWKLVKSGLHEPEIVALMSGKRTEIAASIGWPGKADTVKFLTNLRLRWVDQNIAEQVEVCLLDDKRLSALQDLPRINSMALTLAARFPDLIGSKLHHALAQLPCRPMQCQSMVALLDDAYRLAEFLHYDEQERNRIGQCRYLSEVTEIYNGWLANYLRNQTVDTEMEDCEFNETPQPVLSLSQCFVLSRLQKHAWFTDFSANMTPDEGQLYVWQDEDGVWGALISSHLPSQPELAKTFGNTHGVERIRGLENCLPGAKQLSTLHLWQAQQLKQTD